MAAQQRERMVRGVVEGVNERGVKVGGAWLNFSKFAEVSRPDVGDEVEVVVKDDKWVQGLKVVGAGGQVVPRDEYDPSAPFGNATGGAQDDDPGSWGYGSSTAAPSRRAAPVLASVAPAKASSRATLRAAALAASAHFHSTGDGREDAVYDTAARFLAWIESDEA